MFQDYALIDEPDTLTESRCKGTIRKFKKEMIYEDAMKQNPKIPRQRGNQKRTTSSKQKQVEL